MFGAVLFMTMATGSPAAIAQTSEFDFGSWVPLDSPHYWSSHSGATVWIAPRTSPLLGGIGYPQPRTGVQLVTTYYSAPGSTPRYTESNYLARDALDGPAQATLVIHVPANAWLTVGGALTRSTGTTRRFVSPHLERGKSYTYLLRAEVVRKGVVRSVSRTVYIRAGRRYNISLLLPPPRIIPPRHPNMLRALPGL